MQAPVINFYTRQEPYATEEACARQVANRRRLYGVRCPGRPQEQTDEFVYRFHCRFWKLQLTSRLLRFCFEPLPVPIRGTGGHRKPLVQQYDR